LKLPVVARLAYQRGVDPSLKATVQAHLDHAPQPFAVPREELPERFLIALPREFQQDAGIRFARHVRTLPAGASQN
jgi:hypothetical protein